MEYVNLLKKAKQEIPKIAEESSRFEIPEAKWHLEGNKTIIVNFVQIANTINRDPLHLLKFLQRELATPADIDNNRLILKRKLSASLINSKIELYINTFVICKECKKPDTKIVTENKVHIMKCMACGSRHPIRAKI